MAQILLIEDDNDIRQLMKQFLEQDGHTVVEASNGKTAVEIYYKEQPDLIITDIVMPEKNGIEVISELKSKYPHIKIIAISGGGDLDPSSYLFTARKLGAAYTLKKPFLRAELIEAVKALTN